MSDIVAWININTSGEGERNGAGSMMGDTLQVIQQVVNDGW